MNSLYFFKATMMNRINRMFAGLLRVWLRACALSIFLLTPSAWAEPLLTNPVAPQGLENKYDYATVDISTLNEWEKTFVSDARKEPILKHILSVVDWQLKPDAEQAPYCASVFDKLLKWEDVKIVEPTFRTNSYGGLVFSEWHEKCPGFIPHKSKGSYRSAAAVYYNSHHFKVYEFPETMLPLGQALFYGQGNPSYFSIDGYGNKGERHFGNPDGRGRYRIVDIENCATKQIFRSLPSTAFSYPPRTSKLPYAESLVMEIIGRYFIVAAQISGVTKNHFLHVNQLGPNSDYVRDPDCRFSPK